MIHHAAPADLAGLLASAAGSIAAGDDLDTTLGTLLAGATALTDAAVAALFVHEPDGAALQLAATGGFAPEAIDAFAAEVVADPGHPIARAARDGRAAVGRVGTRPDGATMTGVDLPLATGREGITTPLGVLSLGWPGERTIDDRTLAALRAVASLAALAIERARSTSLADEHSEWQDRVAGLDPLTGLANRRTLDRVLELEIERAKRQGTEISVAVFDVDAFRALNQRDGTAAGDAVLRRVAAILAEQVRLVDTVARVGGDEFVVLAPGSGGVVVADRIIRAIEALGPSDAGAVTISAGVARFPADGTGGAELLDAALGALAAARDAGAGTVAEVREG